MKKYNEWIVGMGYDSPEQSLAKCKEACQLMIKEFPELRLAGGLVYSNENPDNYHPDYPNQYQHMWCVDSCGNIIDPTVSQYINVPNLQYREMNLNEKYSKCHGCGQYVTGILYYCGKCPWSEDDS